MTAPIQHPISGEGQWSRALLAPHEKAIKAHAASAWADRVNDARRALTKAQAAAMLTENGGYITVRSERMGAALFAQGLVNHLPEKWDAGMFKLTVLGRDVVAALRSAAPAARQQGEGK